MNIKNYFTLLVKERLFLILNLAIIGFLSVAFIPLNLITCSIGVLDAAIFVGILLKYYIDDLKEAYKIHDQNDAEYAQLTFFYNEFVKAENAYIQIQKDLEAAVHGFDNGKTAELEAQKKEIEVTYMNTVNRYMLEYKKYLEKRGKKVTIMKLKMDEHGNMGPLDDNEPLM